MNTPNLLINETSPYLLSHAYNPVNWYPWTDAAFEKAKNEDKPIFLSIGYSTCHWCHVMEKESFEDKEAAAILNEGFVSIKVDREERPDIDSVYMNACQTLTGSGGWPLTIIMTPQQKPFFAGTYLPKDNKYGRTGLIQLLQNVKKLWKENRKIIEENCETIINSFQKPKSKNFEPLNDIADKTYRYLLSSFDDEYGGFGNAPKFPAPHNILFLLESYKVNSDKKALSMAEKTLTAMYKGGIFDHIGYGFSRYSTDKFWLVPHFEKMLYDNALLLSAYVKAYEITKNELYKSIAEKIILYIQKDLADVGGAFYSAQDADIMGEEGKFYVFSQTEIINLLGSATGKAFNKIYNITQDGNFEGKNIPNLLDNKNIDAELPINNEHLIKLYAYRKKRYELKTDDKILTSWNCLMIAALTQAYIVSDNQSYLNSALSAFDFINANLKENDALFTGYREGKRSSKGFLDDYAFYVYACIWLYKATLNEDYINLALSIVKKINTEFKSEEGGYYLAGRNEKLIFRPVETYDGAMPSGNSAMAYNLTFLAAFTEDDEYGKQRDKQIDFMLSETRSYYGGNSFFALACLLNDNLTKVVYAPADKAEINGFKKQLQNFDVVRILKEPSNEYPLKNNISTFYVCKSNTCYPAQNNLLI